MEKKYWLINQNGKLLPNGDIMYKTTINIDRLHLDMNPYTQYTSSYGFTDKELEYGNSEEVLKVQGILALVDCSEKDGGFHAVPGFHKHIKGLLINNLK